MDLDNLYVDGYTIGANPSKIGGGFVIVGKATWHEKIEKKGLTNNEAELRGVLRALELADNGTKIFTDSRNTIAWVRSGKPRARMDLQGLCLQAKKLKEFKNIELVWVPREENDAGLYIENEKYEQVEGKSFY